jgi:rhodanese-related sulfurtransferase
MNKKKRIMVVCRNNLVRSKFVANYLSNKGFLNVKSSGIGFFSYIFGVHFDFERDRDYDLFLAADYYVYDKLILYGIDKKKIINLGIKNIYWYFVPFNFLKIRKLQELNKRIHFVLKKKRIN